MHVAIASVSYPISLSENFVKTKWSSHALIIIIISVTVSQNENLQEPKSSSVEELESSIKQNGEALADTPSDLLLLDDNTFLTDNLDDSSDTDSILIPPTPTTPNEPEGFGLPFDGTLVSSDSTVTPVEAFSSGLSIPDVICESYSDEIVPPFMKEDRMDKFSQEILSHREHIMKSFSSEIVPKVSEPVVDPVPLEIVLMLEDDPLNESLDSIHSVISHLSHVETKESSDWEVEKNKMRPVAPLNLNNHEEQECKDNKEVFTLLPPKFLEVVQESETKVTYEVGSDILENERARITAVTQVLSTVYAHALQSATENGDNGSKMKAEPCEKCEIMPALKEIEIVVRKTCSDRVKKSSMRTISDASRPKSRKGSHQIISSSKNDPDVENKTSKELCDAPKKSNIGEKASASASGSSERTNNSKMEKRKRKQTTLVNAILEKERQNMEDTRAMEQKYKPKKITLNDLVQDTPWDPNLSGKTMLFSKTGDDGSNNNNNKEANKEENNSLKNIDQDNLSNSSKNFQVSPHLLLPFRRRTKERGKIRRDLNNNTSYNNNPYVEKKTKLPLIGKLTSKLERTKNPKEKSMNNARKRMTLIKQQKNELPRPVPSHLKYGVFPNMNLRSNMNTRYFINVSSVKQPPLVAAPVAPRNLIRTVPLKITSDNVSQRNRIKNA